MDLERIQQALEEGARHYQRLHCREPREYVEAWRLVQLGHAAEEWRAQQQGQQGVAPEAEEKVAGKPEGSGL